MIRLMLVLLAMAGTLNARIHYVNRGVSYHIGDNRYERSEDKEFVGAYAVVGREWLQAFRVSAADTVKVKIDSVRGVDDCPYCKIIVAIDSHDMGRLTFDNNGTPFDTLEPLAFEVQPERTYLLKITSYGDVQVDDFVIEGVSVESQTAEITFLRPGPVMHEPGEPLPAFSLPRPGVLAPICEAAKLKESWTLGRTQDKDRFSLNPEGKEFAESGELAKLKPGEAIEFYLRIAAPLGEADDVSREVELLCGPAPESGWVLNFDQKGLGPSHANLMVSGNYRAARFGFGGFRNGQWSKVRLAHCGSRLKLWLQDNEVSKDLAEPAGELSFRMRALGLSVDAASVRSFEGVR